MNAYAQNPVSATAWPWLSARGTAPAPLRPRAFRQGCIMLAIAAALFLLLHHRVLPTIVASLGVCVILSGQFYPPFFLGLDRFGKWLGVAVGRAVTWGLLTPFFYLCFVPGRFFITLRGKDPLHLRFPSGQETFWKAIPRRDPSHAERQF